VDDLDKAIESKDLLTLPKTLSNVVLVALIIDKGAPIELLIFLKSKE